MFRPRIIPVLLLKGAGLVKTVRFSRPTYIGDPLNAVKIFNDLGADELVFLDINATRENRTISRKLVEMIGNEAYMPFSVGGGITKIEQIKDLISSGAEKVVLNSNIAVDTDFLSRAAQVFGNQSLIASVDVRKGIQDSYNIYIKSGQKKTGLKLNEYIKAVEEAGAGEILLNSIDKDGTYSGYDIQLIKDVSKSVSIPVIACGGAGSLEDLVKVWAEGGASACAAGSIFVYHGTKKGILINYPERSEVTNLFKDAI